MATIRRVYKQGNSCVITIPTNVLAHMDCRLGDYLDLFLAPLSTVKLRKHHATVQASSRASPRRSGRKSRKTVC